MLPVPILLVLLVVVGVLVLQVVDSVLEIESFHPHQTTMMETALLCQIRDFLVDKVVLVAVSTMLVAVAAHHDHDASGRRTRVPEVFLAAHK